MEEEEENRKKRSLARGKEEGKERKEEVKCDECVNSIVRRKIEKLYRRKEEET